MISRQTFLQYKMHHVLFWMGLGLLWYYLRYQDYSSTTVALWITMIKLLDLAFLVYLANEVLIPQLLYRKKYFLFTALLLVMIAFSSMLKMYIIGSILHNPALYQWTNGIKARIYDNVIPHFFLVIAGMAFKLLSDYNNMQKRLLQVAKEKAETELSFLKSQINPHFLFNSLNAVYFLIDKSNTEARDALHKFSEMLRYQLYEIKDQKVMIEKEIGYLEDYIGLQQLRMENCRVRMEIAPGLKGFRIEPLLLLPFVENAFKHLSHFGNGRKNEVIINLSRQNDEMEFTVRNTTEERQTSLLPGGIGLVNVKRRLELLYPQKHQLTVSVTEGWFEIYLKIKIEKEWHPSAVSL